MASDENVNDINNSFNATSYLLRRIGSDRQEQKVKIEAKSESDMCEGPRRLACGCGSSFICLVFPGRFFQPRFSENIEKKYFWSQSSIFSEKFDVFAPKASEAKFDIFASKAPGEKFDIFAPKVPEAKFDIFQKLNSALSHRRH